MAIRDTQHYVSKDLDGVWKRNKPPGPKEKPTFFSEQTTLSTFLMDFLASSSEAGYLCHGAVD